MAEKPRPPRVRLGSLSESEPSLHAIVGEDASPIALHKICLTPRYRLRSSNSEYLDMIASSEPTLIYENGGSSESSSESSPQPRKLFKHEAQMVPELEADAKQLIYSDPEAWTYLGEGSANVIMQYKGHDVRLCGRILRLRKDMLHNTGKHGIRSNPLNEVAELHTYFEKVCRPILGGNFLCYGALVEVDPKIIMGIQSVLEHDLKRPENRMPELLDLHARFAVLMPDLSQFLRDCLRSTPIADRTPGIVSVEIKPKKGYLPKTRFMTGVHALKATVCRFCMHQNVKLEDGKWKDRSDYCPLRLFSTKPELVHQALWDMLEVPQNNISIFINGSRELFGNSGDMTIDTQRSLVTDLRQILIPKSRHADLEEEFQVLPDGDWRMYVRSRPVELTVLVGLIEKAFAQTGVMQRIKRVQRLDRIDIDGAMAIYESLVRDTPDSEDKLRIMSDFTDPSWDTCVESALSRSKNANFIQPMDLIGMPKTEKVQLLREFLVSKSARDCSLIVTMSQFDETRSKIVEDGLVMREHTFRHRMQYKVNVIDMDPKPVTRLPRYQNQDHCIVEHFSKYHGSDVRCHGPEKRVVVQRWIELKDRLMQQKKDPAQTTNGQPS
eukprot:Clim_evm6s47 gene=Clim_evmTU6s47